MSLPLTRLLCYLRRAAAPARADSDADLLGRFVRRRDEDAFAALVARHGPMVLHACRRILGDVDAAEDAFQATFLVLARRAASVGRPAALAGWLYGVAARVAREARRRDARQPRPGPAEAPEPPDPRPDPLSELTARDLLAVLEQEVRRLPEAYRLPVVLCCLEGLSQEEAARRLGCSAAAVRGRLERGRRRLHDRLAKRGLGLPAALGAAEAARGAPGVLSEAAARAAARFAAGETSAAKVISPRVVALTEGVLRAMLLTRLHTAVTLLLVLGLAGLACGALLGRKADNPGRATAPPPGGAEDPARPPGVRPEPPDEAKAKPAEEGPTAYVRVEAKGTLVRTDKGYAVRAKDAVFPDVTVLVYLERGEDKNRALDDHLRSLEGKAVTEETATAAGKAATEGARPLSRNAYKLKLIEVAVKRAALLAAGKKPYWEA